jgi:hypothetical protein
MKLAAAEVWRSGRTARMWNTETKQVSLDPGKEGLSFEFELRSKGGGVTEVKLTIGPEDFRTIITVMARARRSVAVCEMAAALANELKNQASHDAAKIRKGRQSVVEAAERALTEAPAGRDHAERLMREMVEELVERLNKEDETKSTVTKPV